MKKTLALILTLVTAVCVLTGCGQPKKEPVEIFINVPVLTIDCIANPEFKESSDFVKAAWDKFTAQYNKYDVRLRDDKIFTWVISEYPPKGHNGREKEVVQEKTAENRNNDSAGIVTVQRFPCRTALTT